MKYKATQLYKSSKLNGFVQGLFDNFGLAENLTLENFVFCSF